MDTQVNKTILLTIYSNSLDNFLHIVLTEYICVACDSKEK